MKSGRSLTILLKLGRPFGNCMTVDSECSSERSRQQTFTKPKQVPFEPGRRAVAWRRRPCSIKS